MSPFRKGDGPGIDRRYRVIHVVQSGVFSWIKFKLPQTIPHPKSERWSRDIAQMREGRSTEKPHEEWGSSQRLYQLQWAFSTARWRRDHLKSANTHLYSSWNGKNAVVKDSVFNARLFGDQWFSLLLILRILVRAYIERTGSFDISWSLAGFSDSLSSPELMRDRSMCIICTPIDGWRCQTHCRSKQHQLQNGVLPKISTACFCYKLHGLCGKQFLDQTIFRVQRDFICTTTQRQDLLLKFGAMSLSTLHSFCRAKMHHQGRHSELSVQGWSHIGYSELTTGYSTEPCYKLPYWVVHMF